MKAKRRNMQWQTAQVARVKTPTEINASLIMAEYILGCFYSLIIYH